MIVALVLTGAEPNPAAAEWQIKPFGGVTFGGDTSLIDPEQAVGVPNVVFGVSGLLLGEVLGIEGDLGIGPGFFDADSQGELLGPSAGSANRDFFAASRVITYTANVVVALPRRMAEYSLRPFVVGGAGLMRITIKEYEDAALPGGLYSGLGSINMATVDVGGGVTGFLSERVGLSWELRWFRSLKGQERGVSLGSERLSFWRANMAVAIRY